MGYRLLLKMGWNGDAAGNSAAVAATKLSASVRVNSRLGFGFEERPDAFAVAVKQIFDNLVESVGSTWADDVVFSSELTEAERKVISTEAKKREQIECRTETDSAGSSLMVVGIKRSPIDTVKMLMNSSSRENDSYRLVTPMQLHRPL